VLAYQFNSFASTTLCGPLSANKKAESSAEVALSASKVQREDNNFTPLKTAKTALFLGAE